MDQQPKSPNEDIKPIGELDAPPASSAETPPANPGGEIPPSAPTPVESGPPSLESLAAQEIPDEKPVEIKPPEPISSKPEQTKQALTEPKAEEAPRPTPAAPPPPPGYRPPEAPSASLPPQDIPVGKMPLPAAPPKAPAPPIGSSAIIHRSGNRLLTIVSVVVATLLVLGLAFFLFFYRATLVINPTPAADKITLDGKEIAPGSYKLMPGDHNLTVSKSGYITLSLTQHFSINQKLDLDSLQLQKAIAPTLIEKGATRNSISGDGNYVNFVSPEGQLQATTVSAQGGKYPVTPLSVGLYPTIRELIFGQDNTFAFILDDQAFKVLDFKKTNLVDQKEAILPPDATRINSFSTNKVKSDAFGSANSQIVYDLKTDTDWFLYLADRDHKQAQILMQIDPNVFSSMSIDWGQNQRQLLLVGGSAAIYDLPTRDFEEISDETGFVSGSWGPSAKYAVAVKDDGELYILKNGELQDQNLKAKNGIYTWISASEIVGINDQGAFKINFDTSSTINYAEIVGLQNSSFIAVSGNSIFFCDAEGLKIAPLKENVYGI